MSGESCITEDFMRSQGDLIVGKAVTRVMGYIKEDDYNAAKFDQGKPRYSLIEDSFLLELARVMTMGAEKYSEDSWKTVPNGKQRYKDALLRHIYAEEKIDKESGLSHMAHVAANAMFLYYLEGNDDSTG